MTDWTDRLNFQFYSDDFSLRIKEVIIEDGITGIGYLAFGYCVNLKSITIPDVKIIKEGAFDYCTSLTSITIPESVITVEDALFEGCENLTSVTFPSSMTEIGSCKIRLESIYT